MKKLFALLAMVSLLVPMAGCNKPADKPVDKPAVNGDKPTTPPAMPDKDKPVTPTK
ncbi:MAG TPA: hypothetical protein VFE24_12465 [Pirellulales bacterium]|nr:hypothetical protein [Pirellulales bacterium]